MSKLEVEQFIVDCDAACSHHFSLASVGLYRKLFDLSLTGFIVPYVTLM
jgi:hypothetical protein